MAYKNLIGQSCVGGTEEVFQRIRDFLCKRNGTYDYSTTGIGWTLHDSYYATDENNCAMGDWFVVKSPGENGNEDLYFKITWYSADHLNIYGMLYWNAATDTAVEDFGSTTGHVVYADVDGTVSLWIYGDLNHFVLVTKIGTAYYGADAGRTTNLFYDTTVATCAGALSSGSDISIVVDNIPSEWAVDKYLFIRDEAGLEKIKIKTLNGGTKTITADLVNSYTAGSKLAADLCYYTSSGNQLAATAKYTLIDHNAAKGSSLQVGYNSSVISSCDPDEMNGAIVGAPVSLYGSTAGYQGEMRDWVRIDSGIAGVNSEDVYTDADGVNWRIFACYSNNWVAIKEV